MSGWRRGHLVLGPAVLALPAIALCSRQLRLMDVALGLGFKAGDVCSLSRSSGMCAAHVTRLGDWGRTRRPAGYWVCMLSLWSSLK